MAPLAAGALSALASTGVSKIFGNGLIIPVPYPHPSKQQELLNKAGPYLTNAQINQMLKSNKLKLTKKKKAKMVEFCIYYMDLQQRLLKEKEISQ